MQYTVLARELLANYHALEMRNVECMLIIHLIDFEQHGNNFPSFDQLAKRMGLSENDITDMIKQMIAKGWLEIVQDRQEGRYGDHFDLTPLQRQLQALDQPDARTGAEETSSTDQEEIFEIISNEFGRPLSQIEYQEIARWMTEDGYEPSTIKEAVKEAVIHQVYNLRYISRILYNWKQRNKKTTTQDYRTVPQQSGPRPTFQIKPVLRKDNKK
ncbi:MAG: DnaD domain protein [Aerococcus sp.]|nr:DnaD domain protein [Aerococcus sp.]